MARSYQVLRVEPSTDRQGTPEVFVTIDIFDDEIGIINFARWFHGKPAENIIADPTEVDKFIVGTINILVQQKKIELKRDGLMTPDGTI